MPDDIDTPLGRREFLEATGSIGAMVAVSGIATADRRASGPKPDELLVGIMAGERLQTAEGRVRDALPASADVVHRNETLGYLAVRFPDKSTVAATSPEAARLRQVPGVTYVEENHTCETCFEPDDPSFDVQYAPQLVNAPEAWETTTGSEDVTIAVVDTGVKYDHEDLESRFGQDKGWDFVDGDPDPMPETSAASHGTHMCGIAAATIDNATGISGIANARLLSCRAVKVKEGATSDIADAIQWAADQGADLINLSVASEKPSSPIEDAIHYALDAGALSIAGAGNDEDGDGDRDVRYPAAYDETIAVSAIDSDEVLWGKSHYGEEVDLTAPGVNILSCSTQFTGYESYSGTSTATSMVTGVAALALAVHSDWGPSELRTHLTETAVDVGLPTEKQGFGRVDAANIVNVGDGPNRAPTATMDVSTTEPEVGEWVTFDGSESTDPDGEIVEYRWEDDDGDVLTGEVVEAFGPEERAYPVTLTVTDDDGATDSTTQTIYVGGKDDNAVQNEPPTADFTITPSDPEPGQTVTLDATPSSDPDGEIAEYYWAGLEDGYRYGEVIEDTAPTHGFREVSLKVTDDDGAIDHIARPISVESKEVQRGGTKHVEQTEGTLTNILDSDTFRYTTTLSDPSKVVVTLAGPRDADFDLYVTTDGRDPLVYDCDEHSGTVNSHERIVIEGVDPGQTIGVLVDSWSGSGEYTLIIEEFGR